MVESKKDPKYLPPIPKKDRIPKPAFVDKPEIIRRRNEDTNKLR